MSTAHAVTPVPASTTTPGRLPRPRRHRPEPASLRERAAHVLVDLGVLAVLLAVPALTALAAAVVSGRPPGPGPWSGGSVLPVVAMGAAGLAVLVCVGVVWPHHDGGRTAGMRWAGLRVVDSCGGPPTSRQLLLRALALPLDLLVAGPLVLLREDGRRLGDLLAGTQVVRELSAGAARAPRPGTARCPRARSRTAVPPAPR